MAEWPKAPLSKSGSALKVLVGSNPTLSANETCSRLRQSRGVSLGSSQVSFGLRSDRSPVLRRGSAASLYRRYSYKPALRSGTSCRAPLRDFLAFAVHFSYFHEWRDVRVAEGARLESVWAVISCPVGSNPTLSAMEG